MQCTIRLGAIAFTVAERFTSRTTAVGRTPLPKQEYRRSSYIVKEQELQFESTISFVELSLFS